MDRKHFAIAALISVALVTLTLSPLSNQQGDAYDPWIDYNDDGTINGEDFYAFSQTYGSSGNPTKNVNVTNWPVEPKLFQETLDLKPHTFPTHPTRYALISETEAYLQGSQDIDYAQTPGVSTTIVQLYNRTFIHNDIPTHLYQILGMPTIYLPANISSSSSGYFYIMFHAYLGKISWSGEWTELQYLGYDGATTTGVIVDYPLHFTFGYLSSPLNITINTYERLAIRFYAEGWIDSGTTNVAIDLQCNENLHAIIQVPIVKNP